MLRLRHIRLDKSTLADSLHYWLISYYVFLLNEKRVGFGNGTDGHKVHRDALLVDLNINEK